MNKLEEYRDAKASALASSIAGRWDEDFEEGIVMGNEQGFIKGFDAAIALELPIKFHDWCVKCDEEYKNFVRSYYGRIAEKDLSSELYQYWLENIYNPEAEARVEGNYGMDGF